MDLVIIIILASSLATVITVIVLTYQVYLNRKTVLADFTFKLHEAFFFKPINQQIIRAIEREKKIFKENGGKFSREDIDDFLGYFELMSIYWKLGILKLELINDMFGYYIRNTYENEEIQAYLEEVQPYYSHFIELAERLKKCVASR